MSKIQLRLDAQMYEAIHLGRYDVAHLFLAAALRLLAGD
jgi:hypothetical protein